MCTFQIIYHKKEYIQLVSVWNSTWTLGFSRRGIPIRARASHKRKGKRKTSAPNACTLFLRQRSDEQLLQRLADLSRDQQEYRQKISAHNAQIKKIEMSNSPLAQDSLIMAKIERLRRKQDGQATWVTRVARIWLLLHSNPARIPATQLSTTIIPIQWTEFTRLPEPVLSLDSVESF